MKNNLGGNFTAPVEGTYQVTTAFSYRGIQSSGSYTIKLRPGDTLRLPDWDFGHKCENVRGVVTDCVTAYVSNWNKFGNKYLLDLGIGGDFFWSIKRVGN